MNDERTRSDLRRYLLWQIPGWVVAGGVLAVIVFTVGLSWSIVVGGLAVLVARDVALYPAMRAAFRPATPVRPLGARGVAVEALRPDGMVRVEGELWRAHAVDGPIPKDGAIVVTDVRGLTLLVKRPGGGGQLL